MRCLAVALVMLAIHDVTSAGVVTGNPELPPDTGVYRFEGPITYAGFGFHMVLEDGLYKPLFDPPPVRTPVGNDEEELFDVSLTGTAVVTWSDFGLDGDAIPLEMIGPNVTVTKGKIGNTTGTFDAEIVLLELVGDLQLPGGGSETLMLRESPDILSPGQTSIADLGEGLYHIDSFFDVFTELSVDGGGTWISSADSVRMTLASIPEPPTAVSLLGLSLMGILFYWCRRRRHKVA